MTAEALLKQHGLRKTSIRIEILNLFRQQTHALSASDLERTLPHYDRVTVYRTLNAYEASGIIHQVPDEGYGVKYALCSPGCPDQTHDDEHVALYLPALPPHVLPGGGAYSHRGASRRICN